MNRPILWMSGSVVLLIALLSMMIRGNQLASSDDGSTEPLTLYCAASNRTVVESILAAYKKEFDRNVQVQYGPSQTLLSTIEVGRTGDLFLPADESYLNLASAKGLIAEVLPVATMRVGVAVRKDFPVELHSLAQLQGDRFRLVQANPETAAIGKVTQAVLDQADQWVKTSDATVAFRATVTEVANDIVIGAADAGFVYDAVLHPYGDLRFVALPELKNASSRVSIGVLDDSPQPSAALHLARYIAANDRGLKHYAKQGFTVASGDAWADVPELSIFAGSMLRPAIDETITRFEIREGVKVNRIYNGCGILVAQMQAGQHPDAYFACDSEFMDQVHDLFRDPVSVSENELVILVQKGNPHGIASLRDLTRPELRVGIGHEKQCAMGWLTQNTFRESGIQKEIMPNVTVQLPTGDMLINQMQAGSLDAAVAYLSNAAGAADFIDPIRIQGLECSVAAQPWAVSKDSKFPQTANRLFARICSADSQDVFTSEGFRWQLDLSATGSE
ncbi:MAG: molybdate ABC transporter substrate-binding protein [Planctomycetota bacterium]